MHDAIISERVNWVFEADIRKFYNSIDHEWLMRMVEHRIADPRILRLIRQWLEVGVLENGVYAETVEGTPQGAGISPLLANIFLHYALDLWVGQWTRRAATGQMRLVRYADDFLLTFERRVDADRMATALAERLAKFGLCLHEDKTRLIEFGRFAATNRRRRGEGRPETFDFLGFTHYCGKTLNGRFMVHRKTQRGRSIRKLREVRQELKRRMHTRLREQHGWLARVLRGHYAYYGVTGNSYGLRRFLTQTVRAWHGAICGRAKATNVVGPFQCSSARQPAAAAAARARLARPSGLIRVYSPEEPDAEKLQVRICGGGGGRPPPLPDHFAPAPEPRERGGMRTSRVWEACSSQSRLQGASVFSTGTGPDCDQSAGWHLQGSRGGESRSPRCRLDQR